MGAAGLPIYPGGGRLCLSACPGDGGVKKNCRPPPRIISGTALKDVDLEAMPMSIFLNDDVDDDFDTIGKLVFTGSRSKVDN